MGNYTYQKKGGIIILKILKVKGQVTRREKKNGAMLAFS